MTDNEIIKALEFCSNCVCDNEKTETECPLINMPFCKNYLRKQSIALITRQKAEIERLENDLEEMASRLGILLWHATDGKLSKSNYTTEVMVCALNDYIQKCCEEAEAEAIKEFAEMIIPRTDVRLISDEEVERMRERLIKSGVLKSRIGNRG